MNLYGNQSKSYLESLLRKANNSPKALSYQKLTVAGTAVALTVPAEATYAEITVESDEVVVTTAAIRYNMLGDASLPTAANGIPELHLAKIAVFDQANLINFRAIQIASGTHSLSIQYFK